jgi:hypothetical protein
MHLGRSATYIMVDDLIMMRSYLKKPINLYLLCWTRCLFVVGGSSTSEISYIYSYPHGTYNTTTTPPFGQRYHDTYGVSTY